MKKIARYAAAALVLTLTAAYLTGCCCCPVDPTPNAGLGVMPNGRSVLPNRSGLPNMLELRAEATKGVVDTIAY